MLVTIKISILLLQIFFKELNMLKTKQFAVYPSHGVGYIEKIETKEIHGIKQRYYILSMEKKNMKIFLPVKKTEELGLRPIMSTKDVSTVFRILKAKSSTKRKKDWKERYQESLNKFKTGTVKETAELVRDLYRRNKKDDLSVMEKKLFDAAFKLLVEEVGIVKDLGPEEATALILKHLVPSRRKK